MPDFGALADLVGGIMDMVNGISGAFGSLAGLESGETLEGLEKLSLGS